MVVNNDRTLNFHFRDRRKEGQVSESGISRCPPSSHPKRGFVLWRSYEVTRIAEHISLFSTNMEQKQDWNYYPIGGDSLEIVRPLEYGDVCGKIFFMHSSEGSEKISQSGPDSFDGVAVDFPDSVPVVARPFFFRVVQTKFVNFNFSTFSNLGG